MSIAVDNRQVVLLKSLRTNNRFYTLVEPDSGYKNAAAIEEFPPGLPLGIAYPCLEDGLNDFAVIRTTFETIDVFPDDEDLRGEMMLIIHDARGNLLRRLQELRDRLLDGQAHFLGTDYNEFKSHMLHLCNRGAIRRTLDNMMKLDIYESVAKAEAGKSGMPDPMFRYVFLPQNALDKIQHFPPRQFISRLFDDVLDSVKEDDNYRNKYTFDKHVFQKFVAAMFVNYATTDPSFYGTSREDYGVSSDKDMNETPLYRAIGKALRQLERGIEAPEAPVAPETAPAVAAGDESDLSFLFSDAEADAFLQPMQDAGRTLEIPFGAAERMLLGPLALLADAVRLLKHVDSPHAAEVRSMAATAGQEIFRNLQRLNILSPLASDPMDDARE